MQPSLECFNMVNFILKESVLIYSIWIYISFVQYLGARRGGGIHYKKNTLSNSFLKQSLKNPDMDDWSLNNL